MAGLESTFRTDEPPQGAEEFLRFACQSTGIAPCVRRRARHPAACVAMWAERDAAQPPEPDVLAIRRQFLVYLGFQLEPEPKPPA